MYNEKVNVTDDDNGGLKVSEEGRNRSRRLMRAQTRKRKLGGKTSVDLLGKWILDLRLLCR